MSRTPARKRGEDGRLLPLYEAQPDQDGVESMLDLLERYEKAIEEFVTEWPECWGFIAKAEDQARRDEMERIRRRADEDSAMGRDWCKDYTTARPWEFTFAQLPNPRHEY